MLGGSGGLTSGLLSDTCEVGAAGDVGGKVNGVGGRGSWGCLVVGEMGPWPLMRRRTAWPERDCRVLTMELTWLFLIEAAVAEGVEVVVVVAGSCSRPS